MPHPRQSILILTALIPEARALAKQFTSDPQVKIEVIGMGAHHLPLVPPETRGIVLAGLGGGLAPALKIGDVVTDSEATPIHTSPTILRMIAQKRDVYERTGAHVVDMETQPVRQFAAEKGLAFVSIRAISDTAGEELDPAFLQLVDERGGVRLWRVIGLIGLRPWKIPALLRLKRNSDTALANLAGSLRRLIDSGWPGRSQ